MSIKGIKNSGENNCFLNVCLQFLYLLFSFNNSSFISNLNQSSIPASSVLIPLLKNLLLSYQRSATLDPLPLRSFLSSYYEQVNKFKLKDPADCIEALLAILEILHLEFSNNADCGGRCISHQLFHLEVFEQYECECRATSEVLTWDFCTFSLNFYADELVNPHTDQSLVDLSNKEFAKLSQSVKVRGKFPEFLKEQLENCSVPACPEPTCKKKQSKRRIHIINSRPNLVFSIIWFKQPTFLQVSKLLASIPQVLRGAQISSGFSQNLSLTGLVLYNKFHYFSYVFNQRWHRCDDTIVRQMDSFFSVLEDAVQSMYWPVALFYSVGSASAEETSVDSLVNLEKMSILLEIQQTINDASGYWTCQCSADNEDMLLICQRCYRSRFNDYEWECDQCGSLNSEVNKQCLYCNSFLFQPTQSSYHTKLSRNKIRSKSSKFTNPQIKDKDLLIRSQTGKFNIEATKKLHDEQKISQKFVNSTEIIQKALKQGTQSSSFNMCLKCSQRVRNHKLCDDCKMDYWVCNVCEKCCKKNGQRCSCDIRSNTTRFK